MDKTRQAQRRAFEIVRTYGQAEGFIERQALMMILRGGFVSAGWRLAVRERCEAGALGVIVETIPVPPGELPPAGAIMVIGR